MKNFNWKRTVSMLLAVLMVMGACPITAFAADQSLLSAHITQKVADPGTINEWRQLMGSQMSPVSTVNAGGVWTDKSVFTDAGKYTDMLPVGEKIQTADVAVGENNFLVSLSAITSNKSVVGYDTIPTDTMMILDISSSMYNGGSFTPGTVETMVTAVNDAITELQALNRHNRVGVVLYFGGPNRLNSTSDSGSATVLLPLDRYTHSSNKFLTANKSGGKLTALAVNTNVKNTAGTTVTGSHDVSSRSVAGTFIQQGIHKAWQQFASAETIIPSTAAHQAGQTRLPVYVLMSDGEPTAASSVFATPGVSQMGNNTISLRNPAETDFVTQLTAALAKERADRHYVDTTPLFYSLSLGYSISPDVMQPAQANSSYTSKIAEYWNNLLNQNSVQISVKNSPSAYADATVTANYTVT